MPISLNNLPVTKMIPRLTALIIVVGGIIAVASLGMGQFGYPYIGMLGGMASLFKTVDPTGRCSLFLLPLMAIGLMIGFALLVLFTNAILLYRICIPLAGGAVRNMQSYALLILSGVLLLGLSLCRVFPGEQEDPISFSNGFFIYPLFLFFTAIALGSPKSGKKD